MLLRLLFRALLIAAPASAAKQFLLFTDIHLDRSYNQSLSGLCFCNSPANLPPSTLHPLIRSHVPLWTRMFRPEAEVNEQLVTACERKSPGNRYGQWQCDAPLQLVQSALANAAKVSKPEFIIMVSKT